MKDNLITETNVYMTTYPNERRATPRLAAMFDSELVATLSILDTNSGSDVEPLIFFGQTIDLSLKGIGLKIPLVPIDERYCDGHNRMRLAVQLPNGSASFEVNAVRCMPLDKRDRGEGYVVGTQILRVLQYEGEFVDCLRSLEMESVK